MRRRVYELAIVGLAYIIDPDVLMAIWILELSIWYFSLTSQPVKRKF
ncbi:MAG: hypothetical protein ACC707_16785 [Thiohalomonadales bacterium]